MTDDTDKAAPEAAAPEEVAPEDAAPEDAAPRSAQSGGEAPRRGSQGVAFFVLILLLLAVGGAYYWVTYVHLPETTALEQRVQGIDQADVDLAERIDQGAAQTLEQSQAHDALVADVAALRQAQQGVQDSITALYAKESKASLNWVLAEAEYLVLAASQRLALERDVRTALAALRAADDRLRSAEHPELIGVREQLAKDIAALEGVNLPDVEGLAIYLAETVARVDELPTKPIADIDMSFSRMSGEPATPENWQGVAKAMWADLVSLIEIKDGDLPDGVLFDPELRYFLQQNLRLELASARLSVLRRDNANFQAASKLIIDLLNQYYDTADAAVVAIVERLAAGQEIDLDPQVPAISASLDTVRAKRLSTATDGAADVAARH